MIRVFVALFFYHVCRLFYGIRIFYVNQPYNNQDFYVNHIIIIYQKMPLFD